MIRMKIRILIGFLLVAINMNALTPQQQQAEDVITKYYESLEQLSNQPTPNVEQQIIKLFVDGGFVYNDLYVLESERGNGLIKENQLSDIAEYIGTIRNLWSKNISLNFQVKIDQSSFIELSEPSYNGIEEKAIWVTVDKYISHSGKLRIPAISVHQFRRYPFT